MSEEKDRLDDFENFVDDLLFSYFLTADAEALIIDYDKEIKKHERLVIKNQIGWSWDSESRME